MKEKIKKPKCKGVWKICFTAAGVFAYKCTKCGQEISNAEIRNNPDHRDVLI